MATSPNQALLRAAVSHQVGLGRYSTAVAGRAVALLNSLDHDLLGAVGEVRPSRPTSVTSALTAIRRINTAALDLVGGYLGPELESLAAGEAGGEGTALGLASGETLSDPSAAALRAVVYSQPFQGGLLREWVAGMDTGRFTRLRQAVRHAVATGQSQDDLLRVVQGTATAGYRDGILDISRRSAVTISRTAVAHVASAAREAYWAANGDLVRGVRWVSTLDSRTTPTCASLDGRVFQVGVGLRPPAHLGCRSTTTAVLRGEADAPRLTYADWFSSLTGTEQDEIMGPTRGRLYRLGKVPLGKFVDRSGVSYTLDQLRRRQTAAFAAAGL